MAGESSELGKLLRFELPEGQVLFAHQHCASWGQNLIHVGRNPVRNKPVRTLFPSFRDRNNKVRKNLGPFFNNHDRKKISRRHPLAALNLANLS